MHAQRIGAGAARSLLDVAGACPNGPRLRRPRGRHGSVRTVGWSGRLDRALTAGCLLDLMSEGRIEQDTDRTLRVRTTAATGSAAHDLVLRRMHGAEPPLTLASCIREFSREVGAAMIAEAVAGGLIPCERRSKGYLPQRTEYRWVDDGRAGLLRDELRLVYLGRSDDPRATALLKLIGAAGLADLVPGEPSLASLRRRVERLPSSAIAIALGEAAADMALRDLYDPTTSVLWGDVTWSGGWFDGGGGGGGGDGGG
jgi:hypothetical protein